MSQTQYQQVKPAGSFKGFVEIERAVLHDLTVQRMMATGGQAGTGKTAAASKPSTRH